MAFANAGAPAPPRHLACFDAMRGFAIVFVVYLHAYFSAWAVTPARDRQLVQVVHLFAHTAVPVFLFISGYLLADHRSPGFRAFVSRKVVRIGVPLLFWMTAALFYRGWDEGSWTSPGLWKDYLLFNVSGQFYYLFVLIVFYVAFFPIRGWGGRRLALVAAAAFVANLAMIAWYEHATIAGDLATLAYRNPLTWVFFFAFGMAVARRAGGPSWPPAVVSAAGLAMAALFAAYLVQGHGPGGYPVSYFGVVVFLFSAAALAVYPSLLTALSRLPVMAKALTPMEHLGGLAFGIYLVHMPFFIGFVTGRLVSGSRLADDYLQLMHGIFAVGLLTSAAFVALASLLFPRGSALLLGVQRRPAATRAGSRWASVGHARGRAGR